MNLPVLGDIHPKVAVGSGIGAATGFVVWALVAFVPAFRNGVPEPVVAVLPFALGWLGHVIGGYLTPSPKKAP